MISLLKKDVRFRWSDLCQEAFDNLKSILTKEPLLQYPDFGRTFNLTSDASNFAIGSVLSQGPIGQDAPIAYASRTLNKAEQNYNTTEKELCAIIWGVKDFRPYLLGLKFKIITDHQALSWLFNIKDPGSRLTRWRLKLEEYEYEIIYKPGVSNTNADALSRIHPVNTRSKTIKRYSNTPDPAKHSNIPDLTDDSDSSDSPKHSDIPESTEDSDTSDPTENPDISDLTENADTLDATTLSNTSDSSRNYQNFLLADRPPTTNVIEVTGDLFETASDISLAHCVSADLKMSKGIAQQFRRKFGQLSQLRQQAKSVNDVAYIQLDNRTIFYLITKEFHWSKPTYESMFATLGKLKGLCEQKQISDLAFPRLGCGLDKLN